MFHEFLSANRDTIIARTRERVAARPAPRASEEELERGIPLFLDQLIDTLRFSRTSSAAMDKSATIRGRDLLNRGFTVAQVVHDYGDVCQVVTELAREATSPITADEFHTFNRCLDDAIAGAVTEHTRTREQSISDAGTEQLGELAHEIRNAIGVAMLSFQTLKSGSVGLGGATAFALEHSLRRIASIVDSSVAQVRLGSGIRNMERVSISEFVAELEVGASMEANALDLTLTITRVERGLDLDADRQLLAAAVTNLLHNAFKFTRSKGNVSLAISSSGDRVLIDVADECGGLPPGKADELFRPFEQRSANRTGLGLGLSISRKSAEANGGEIRVRDIPGTGCVFTIDLPRRSPAG